MKTIPFIKMHGIGNDYVYIDCFQESTARVIGTTDLSDLARRMSDRHKGIGADGIVLILPSQKAVAKMRIFNADGSEAQMCGNAIRCVGKYMYEHGICREKIIPIETLSDIKLLTLHVEKEQVKEIRVDMGHPIVHTDSLQLSSDKVEFTSVNMGNPHAVFFHDNISVEEAQRLGQLIGTHPHFPEGTNVEFVHVRTRHEIDVMVWERGSGVTMACGTGSCAAMIAAQRQGMVDNNVTVHLPGGDLDIEWDEASQTVYMTGPATEVYRGEYLLTD